MKKQDTDRRKYTAEFKAEAVALARKREKPVSHVAVETYYNRVLEGSGAVLMAQKIR